MSKISILELIGFVFIILVGAMFHFIYEWSGHNKFAAFFCAVNESVWEHMKMAMGPSFLWILIEMIFLMENDNFFIAKFVSLAVMLVSIPAIFYVYYSVLKKEVLIFGILDFFISILLGQMASNAVLHANVLPFYLKYLSIVGLVVIFILYMTRTFIPGKGIIFKDFSNDKYGLNAHTHHNHHKN